MFLRITYLILTILRGTELFYYKIKYQIQTRVEDLKNIPGVSATLYVLDKFPFDFVYGFALTTKHFCKLSLVILSFELLYYNRIGYLYPPDNLIVI